MATRTYLIALTIIATIVFWRVLFINAYFGWGDARVFTRFNETWHDFVQPPSLWFTLHDGLGDIELSLSAYPLYAGYGLLTRMGIDTRVVAKLLFFIPSAFLPTFGSFILIRHFTKNNTAAFMGSIVYSYNVYILLTQTTLLQISIAYALAPLSLILFIKSIEKQKLKISLITGLALFINSVFEFRIFYIVSGISGIYILYVLSTNFLRRKPVNVGTLIHSAIPFIVVLSLNFYWLLPITKAGLISDNTIFSRPLFGDQYMSLRQSLAFFMPWWTGGHGYASGIVQPIPAQFWIIPVLALAGLLLNRKSPGVYFFLVLSILGVILTKQSDKPFPKLYLCLYQNFPGFNAFRESSKFYLILSLGYSGLIAFFIKSLKFSKLATVSAVCLVTALFLWNSRPLITGEIGGLFVPKNRPSDLEVLKDFIHRQDEFFRIGWYPASGIWGFYESKHPKVDLHTAYYNVFGEYINRQPGFIPVLNTSNTISDVNHQSLSVFSQSFSDYLFDSLSMKYVVVPPQDIINDDDVFLNYGVPDREYLLAFFDNIKFLKRLDIGTTTLIVYENQDFKSRFYASSGSIKFSGSSFEGFKLYLDDVGYPTRLSFTDSNNPNWDISVGKKIDSNEMINEFVIDEQPVSQPVLLKFKGQEYVNLGSVVSLLSLGIVLSLIIVYKR